MVQNPTDWVKVARAGVSFRIERMPPIQNPPAPKEATGKRNSGLGWAAGFLAARGALFLFGRQPGAVNLAETVVCIGDPVF